MTILRFNNENRKYWHRVICHVQESFNAKFGIGGDFFGVEIWPGEGDYLIFHRDELLACAIDKLAELQKAQK